MFSICAVFACVFFSAQATDDGNMTYEIHMDERRRSSYTDSEGAYFKEIKQLYMIVSSKDSSNEYGYMQNIPFFRSYSL